MKDNRHTILCIDDEENILSAIRRVLRVEGYNIITSTDALEGLAILEGNNVQLVISDQRMPGMSGTEFLATVRERFPDVVRIILSGYTDIDAITESINRGHIYKLLLKPWNDQALKMEIKQAFEHYELMYANKLLHKKIMEQNNELKDINERMEDLVRSRTEELEIKNQVLELSRAILEYIPVPVIGVSEEGMIVLINRQAEALTFSGRNISIGNGLSDYFESNMTEVLDTCLKYGESQCVKDYTTDGDTYDIYCTPLSGDYRSRGVILSLKSKK